MLVINSIQVPKATANSADIKAGDGGVGRMNSVWYRVSRPRSSTRKSINEDGSIVPDRDTFKIIPLAKSKVSARMMRVHDYVY